MEDRSRAWASGLDDPAKVPWKKRLVREVLKGILQIDAPCAPSICKLDRRAAPGNDGGSLMRNGPSVSSYSDSPAEPLSNL